MRGFRRRPIPTPLRSADVECWEGREIGGFREMDPLHPVSSVLAVTPLAPTGHGVHGPVGINGPNAFAELVLTSLPYGQHLELRMTTKDGLKEGASSSQLMHLWPYSLKILLDGKEIAKIDPPFQQKRGDTPLLLEPIKAKAHHELQLLAWDAPFGEDWCPACEMILCVALVKPRSVTELLEECRQRPGISREISLELHQQATHQVIGSDQEVTCETPWLLPLRCPLTMERLKEPARGIHCKHLQCVELEAFLITASAMSFQRRWRCPVCNAYLPPKQLARCELTRNLLDHFVPKILQVPLDAVLGAAGQREVEAMEASEAIFGAARGQGWGRRLRCEVQSWGELD